MLPSGYGHLSFGDGYRKGMVREGFLPTQKQELCQPRIPNQGLILLLVMVSDPNSPVRGLGFLA